VVLHGGAATINDAVATTMFDQAAAAGNFIVAYPQGTRGEWNAGFCCGTAPGRMVDDVGFLNQVLDHVEADYPVDRNRVFFTGVSNGAMMAYRFACENADRVTAVGSVAGSMVLADCHPSRPLSVIELHGTADPEVPYAGGPTNTAVQSSLVLPSTQEMTARWATLDGCTTPSTPATTGPVTTVTWTGCAGGTSVELVSVQGGGHVWFAPGLGPADGALDATTVFWQFFRQLPNRQPATP
jgi:polyhydroxybutyrate depolymerase